MLVRRNVICPVRAYIQTTETNSTSAQIQPAGVLTKFIHGKQQHEYIH